MMANPEYAEARPCSVESRPRISSSSETLKPIVFLMITNVAVIVTAAHAAVESIPTSWIPKSLNPPP
jgi:hypothetical protein